MPDISLAPAPAPFAVSAATRRDAETRTDGNFSAALDEVAAAEVMPSPRPRADKVVPEPVETVETAETPDDAGPGALDLAAPTPLPTIVPLVTPLPVPSSDTSVPEGQVPEDSTVAGGSAGVPVPAGDDAAALEPSTPNDQTNPAATAAQAAAAAQSGPAAAGEPPARSGPAWQGGTPAQTSLAAEAADAGQAPADLVAQSEAARRGEQANQATRADRAAQTALAAQSQTGTPGLARAAPLQAASIAAALPVVPPATAGENDGTDVPEVPVVATDAAASTPDQPPSAPPPTSGAPRTRDAIDRANADRTGDAGRTSVADPGTGDETTDVRTTPAPDPAAASAARSATTSAPVASPPLAAPLDPAESPTPALASAQVAATEAHAAEVAQSLSLSTTSRASIETTAQIAAQIVRRLEGRSTRFEMALTPEGLGQVDVSLDIDADGRLAARLAFDNPLAATELRGRVDELRRQLQEAGFTVADDALSFSERDPSAGQGSAFDRRPDPRNARAFGAASRLSADADLATAPARWIPLTLTPDRVDMKV